MSEEGVRLWFFHGHENHRVHKSLDSLVVAIRNRFPDFQVTKILAEKLQTAGSMERLSGVTLAFDEDGNYDYAICSSPDSFCRKRGRGIAAGRLVRKLYMSNCVRSRKSIILEGNTVHIKNRTKKGE